MMKKFKIIFIITICFSFMFTNILNTFSLDLNHYVIEEQQLIHEPIVKSLCRGEQNKNANCTKYLIRYDGLASKIEEIKKFIGEEDPIPKTRALEKAGILTTIAAPLGAGLYFAPITTILTTLGLVLGTSVFCSVHNNVIKPSDEILGLIPTSINWIKKLFTGQDYNLTNGGITGDIIITMCGDNSQERSKDGLLERVRKLIFGEKASNIKKTNEQIAYKELLDEFYKQVKKRKFEENDNNILIFCIDSTNVNSIKHKLKFDRTFLNIGDYPNETEDYFKDWL